VESFVYMECVGIQLEKHFSQSRATALSAFEKKTDITSAINIATRKRMPVLVKELQAKLESVGAEVSHTTVKEAKEAHLESKKLKQELHDLAMRQLTRSRETSTERVIALMTVWSNGEQRSCIVLLEVMLALVSNYSSFLFCRGRRRSVYGKETIKGFTDISGDVHWKRRICCLSGRLTHTQIDDRNEALVLVHRLCRL
jgi:hypothetical protein